MEDSSCPMVPSRSSTDMYELNKDLERVIEDVENISVQLTWMAYDMVTLRTGFEREACMRELEEAYSRCRAAVFGEADPQPQMEAGAEKADSSQSQTMENAEKEEEQATTPVSTALENILRGLDLLSNNMDQLALRTHLKQCDLLISVSHPDKEAFLQKKVPEAVKQQQTGL